jgi:hypothetical protein
MSITAPIPFWQSTAILVVRLIFAGVFAMAASFKFLGMEGTAGDIASAGFPFPLLLAWLAALFDTALVICFLSGAFFSEASLLAAPGNSAGPRTSSGAPKSRTSVSPWQQFQAASGSSAPVHSSQVMRRRPRRA